MSYYFEGLVREGKRTALHDGLKAFVFLYYSNYTDATAVEPDTLRLLADLLEHVDLTEDVVEIVTEAEEEINQVGGIRSETSGKTHKVNTYPDEES